MSTDPHNSSHRGLRNQLNNELHHELWTSWASLLRSYAAAHALGQPQHAVVEVSAESVRLRYGAHWLHVTPVELTTSAGLRTAFHLTENGTALINGMEEPMDLAAERLAREIIKL